MLPLLYVVLCPFIPISVRFLAGHIDNLGQNVLRMGAGAIILSAVCMAKHRSELAAILTSPRALAVLFFIGAASVLCVYATVEGVAATSATMAHVVGSIGIPLTVVLAAVLFHDERLITWNKSFILGMLIAVVATAGIALSSGDVNIRYSIGILWLVVSVVSETVVNLVLKHLLISAHPMAASTVIAWFTWLILIVWATAAGSMAQLAYVSLPVLFVALASGAGGLLLGLGLHLTLIRRIGVSAVTVLRLVVPIATGILAWIVIGDRLTFLQIIFGALVVIGSAISFSSSARSR